MFLLLILLGLIALGVHGGYRSAEMDQPQWPKTLLVFAGIAVLLGLVTAWVFTLPWDQQAAMSWALVMFGPWMVLAVIVGVLAMIVEIILRHRARRRAEREAEGG